MYVYLVEIGLSVNSLHSGIGSCESLSIESIVVYERAYRILIENLNRLKTEHGHRNLYKFEGHCYDGNLLRNYRERSSFLGKCRNYFVEFLDLRSMIFAKLKVFVSVAYCIFIYIFCNMILNSISSSLRFFLTSILLLVNTYLLLM